MECSPGTSSAKIGSGDPEKWPSISSAPPLFSSEPEQAPWNPLLNDSCAVLPFPANPPEHRPDALCHPGVEGQVPRAHDRAKLGDHRVKKVHAAARIDHEPLDFHPAHGGCPPEARRKPGFDTKLRSRWIFQAQKSGGMIPPHPPSFGHTRKRVRPSARRCRRLAVGRRRSATRSREAARGCGGYVPHAFRVSSLERKSV